MSDLTIQSLKEAFDPLVTDLRGRGTVCSPTKFVPYKYCVEAADAIEGLINVYETVSSENESNIARIAELEAFRSAVIGWREHGCSDDYDRWTAHKVAEIAEESGKAIRNG